MPSCPCPLCTETLCLLLSVNCMQIFTAIMPLFRLSSAQRQHISLETLPQQEELVDKNRQRSVLLQLLLVCISAGVHALLINQPKLWKEETTQTKSYIQDHSLHLLPYPFLPTVFVCCLWDVCWRCLCHRQVTSITFFSLFLLTVEDSRLDFSETFQYDPYCVYKAKHIHGLSYKIHCYNFSDLRHPPSVHYCLKVTGIRKIEESCNSYKPFILTTLFLPQYFILIPLNFSRNVTELLAYKIINACSNCHACELHNLNNTMDVSWINFI